MMFSYERRYRVKHVACGPVVNLKAPDTALYPDDVDLLRSSSVGIAANGHNYAASFTTAHKILTIFRSRCCCFKCPVQSPAHNLSASLNARLHRFSTTSTHSAPPQVQSCHLPGVPRQSIVPTLHGSIPLVARKSVPTTTSHVPQATSVCSSMPLPPTTSQQSH